MTARRFAWRGFDSAHGVVAMIDKAMQIGCEHFVWALASLCRMHFVAFDRSLLLQQFPPPHTLSSLLRAARALGFDPHPAPAAARQLAVAPCLMFRNEAPAWIVDADGESATLLDPTGARQRTPLHQLSLAGAPLLAFPRTQESARTPAPTDGVAGERFGWRWFVPELLRHRSVWRDVVAASMAMQVLGLGMPLLAQVVVDRVIAHGSINTLLVVAVALVVAVVFGAAMNWMRQHLVLHAGTRVDAVLGMRVFEHLIALPLGFFARRPTGTLVARLQATGAIRDCISGAAVLLLLDVPLLVLSLMVLFWYSVPLALLIATALAAIALASAAIAPMMRERLDRVFLLGARNQALSTEFVAGIETVKSLQVEPQLNRRYADNLGACLEAGFRARLLANACAVGTTAIEQLLSVLVLCLGAWQVMSGVGFTVGMLVAVQMLAARTMQPVLRIAGLWQELQQAAIALRRLGDIMDAPAETVALAPGRTAAERPEIEFDTLGFRHGPDRPFLFRGLSARVPHGSCIALVGPSGSGKSTLAGLLQGFHAPTEGTIRIDGRDVRALASNELRCLFGVVPQETVLFSGTVYENLTMAAPRADTADVVQACRIAGVHEIIEQLPRGYQSQIGEHGAGLSVGQKQRLAIARALLRRAPVLLFDEATASLDEQTAEQVAGTIGELRGRVTIVFIAHRVPRSLPVDATVALAGPA